MSVADSIISLSERRPANFIIGGADNPYIHRWWLIPRNRFFNIYLHHIVRDDDDRALHDHPWLNLSIILRGGYFDVTADRGGHLRRQWVGAGKIKFRSPWAAHRLEVGTGDAWTLFITGPRLRAWGFYCSKGWVHWRDFTSEHDSGQTGRGCGEMS